VIFVSVGTSKYPFVRLVETVDRVAPDLDERVFVQGGATLDAYTPENLEYTDFVSREEYERLVSEARVFVTHAGTGSIITALEAGTPPLLVPREGDRGEHTDDQQLETAAGWAERAGLSVARSTDELERFLREDSVATPDLDEDGVTGAERLQDTIAEILATKAEATGGDLTVVCPSPPGGHLTQLLQLSDVLDEYDTRYLTWDERITGSIEGAEPVTGYHLEEFPDPDMLRDLVVSEFEIARSLLSDPPDVVISTGGGSFVISAVYLAKALGADVIHIESLTRFDSASTTGKILAPIADRLFVQHPAVRGEYGVRAEYEGTLF
jgi:UDP-N-acetylglucosamine transferase subunit ALG13